MLNTDPHASSEELQDEYGTSETLPTIIMMQ
jgi:hypothetical protein